MGNDLDPLDGIFADEAAKKARAVGKFQPKPKVRPQKKGSTTTSVASSKADSSPSKLSKPIETPKPVEQCLNVVPNDTADLHAVTEKPAGENANIFTGLEALDDFIPETSTDNECYVSHSEEVTLNATNTENREGRSGTPGLSSVEDSAHACKAADVPTDPGVSENVTPGTSSEPIVSSADAAQDDMRDRELGEEMDVLDPILTTELTTKSGRRTGKFQPKPKPKPQIQKKIPATESVSDSLGSQSIPPDTDYAEKDLVPTSEQDDVLDLSSLGFTHTLPTQGTSELPLNEESMNLMEVAQLDTCFHLEDIPEVPAKLASRRAKTGDGKTHSTSDPSPQQQKGSTSSQENGTGRSLRPRKGKTDFCELVDEARDEVLASVEVSEDCTPIEEENINNEEPQMESEPQKKKLEGKSKRTDDGKEQPAKKSKKSKEASDQEGVKRKKFSHSTRRRRVDKTLLETPEDEIDYQNVALRDLIQLAEHREREMKIGGAAAGAPATNQSTGNSSGLYNDENFTSEQGGQDNDGQGTPMVDTTEYFNYHHHMDKTSKTRWSKQETELFYKAVQQFGTDFSMIEMVFPDRSRREIKLKYKKEERQHPLRLHEALTSRSGDLSLFQMVKEHLKKIADEEKQNADNDDFIDVTDSHVADEGTLNADDDEAQEEHIEEKEQHDTIANDSGEVQSPLKLDDDGEEEEEEEDFLRWSQYKSDL